MTAGLPGARRDEDAYGPYAQAVEATAHALAATAAGRDRAGGSATAERQLLRDSGLLTLAVPRAHGGQEAPWPLILRIVRRFAQADSSLAHLFGFQHLQVASIVLYGSPGQQARYLGATVEQGWFWGNAVNSRDTRLRAADDGRGGYVLDGAKGFCSGARGSDALIVSASVGQDGRLFAVVPTSRQGVTVHDDWDNMGQRQTDSGTVSFERVALAAGEVLGPPGPDSSPRATLRNLIGQLVLTEIYLGNALGALRAAVDYVRERARPWPMAGVAQARDDGLLQLRAGELWVQWQGAAALADAALQSYQRAWDAGAALTADARGALSLEIAAARVHAGRSALHITAQVFELMGASATARRHGFDRYWRNVRVHTLHDPLDYRQQAIGRWLFTGELPDPRGYG